MTTLVNDPPTNELLDQRTVRRDDPIEFKFAKVRLTTGWQTFFSQIYQVVLSITMSGTTANRPTKFLWIGRFYFDTTLTKPIWVKSVAAGVATWCDATGGTV
jgi:hypothetical protein